MSASHLIFARHFARRTAASKFALRRPVMNTRAPSAANRCAVANHAAPVTPETWYMGSPRDRREGGEVDPGSWTERLRV